ncbi:MAG: superoxide dismutase [Cu-Zn] SodC [Ferrovibrio sp.]
MQRILLTTALVSFAVTASAAFAAEKTIDIMAISASGVGAKIGTIMARDAKQGLVLTPALTGLNPPGPHGFHVHEKPDCSAGPGANNAPAAGMAAGGHFDPAKSGKHRGPHSADGHKGDLPPLVVNGDGTATLPVIAPHLKVKDLSGKALMIHAGGDNYSDDPAPLGGGGPRIACGVIR